MYFLPSLDFFSFSMLQLHYFWAWWGRNNAECRPGGFPWPKESSLPVALQLYISESEKFPYSTIIMGHYSEEDSSTSSASSIPIVDFAGWNSSSLEQKRLTAAQLIEACQSIGFVYIINHQIPRARVTEAFSWSKKLFDLSSEEKKLAPHPPGGAVHRGYSWPGLEKVTNLKGNAEDAHLAQEVRQVADVKVIFSSSPFWFFLFFPLTCIYRYILQFITPSLFIPLSGELRNRKWDVPGATECLALRTHPAGLSWVHERLLLGMSRKRQNGPSSNGDRHRPFGRRLFSGIAYRAA